MRKLLISSFWLSIFAMSCVVMCILIASLLLDFAFPKSPALLLLIIWSASYIGCFIAGFVHIWRYEWRQEDEAMEERRTGIPNNELGT